MISRAADPDRARHPAALHVVQAEDRHRRHALARSGLADDAEGLAQPDRVGQVGDGLHETVVRWGTGP